MYHNEAKLTKVYDSTKLYSAKEVIEILGISRPTLLREINNGNLKAFKAGRQWRITEEALNEYMKPENIEK